MFYRRFYSILTPLERDKKFYSIIKKKKKKHRSKERETSELTLTYRFYWDCKAMSWIIFIVLNIWIDIFTVYFPRKECGGPARSTFDRFRFIRTIDHPFAIRIRSVIALDCVDLSPLLRKIASSFVRQTVVSFPFDILVCVFDTWVCAKILSYLC